MRIKRIKGARCWPTSRRLHKSTLTNLILSFQFVPILDHHFELLEDEAVSESVSARVVLNEVVFVGRALLNSPVDRNSHPAIIQKVPIVRHPQHAGHSEGQLEISTQVVVVKRLVEPIAVSEDDAAHTRV